VAKQLNALEFIETQRLDDESFTKKWYPGVVEELRLRVDDARAKYLALEKGQ